MLLGERIKALRTKANLTRRALSVRTGEAGVTEQTIGRIETDPAANPEFDTLRQLAAALHVTVDQLLKF